MSGKTLLSAPSDDGRPLYYPVSRRKLIVLCIFSLGLYEVYWFYKNWALIKLRTRRDIDPLARAFLAFFYADELFENVASVGRVHMVPGTIRPGLLWLAYVALGFLVNLPSPFLLLALLSFLPLLPVQRMMQDINLRVAHCAEIDDRFRGADIAIIILGSIALIWITIPPVSGWLSH